MDLVQLRSDLQFVEELSGDAVLDDLRREAPLLLRRGTQIVDVDRFLSSLRADCLAVLHVPGGARVLVLEATAHACHNMAAALRDLLETRDSDRAALETLAELEVQAA